MYNWLDRADYQRPCRDFPIRVDREAYCDTQQPEYIRFQALRRARSARTSPKTVSAAVKIGHTVLPPSSAPPKVASGATGTVQFRPIKCELPVLPGIETSSRPYWWQTAEPPRKMTDEQARELYE